MDITFDEIKEFLAEIVQWFGEVAPTVWQIMLKKTYADIAGGALFGLVILITGIVLVRLGSRMKKEDDESDYEISFFVGWLLVPFSVFLIIDAIQRLVAVEYYTLINLFNIVK